jgi:hypothetical protein
MMFFGWLGSGLELDFVVLGGADGDDDMIRR